MCFPTSNTHWHSPLEPAKRSEIYTETHAPWPDERIFFPPSLEFVQESDLLRHFQGLWVEALEGSELILSHGDEESCWYRQEEDVSHHFGKCDNWSVCPRVSIFQWKLSLRRAWTWGLCLFRFSRISHDVLLATWMTQPFSAGCPNLVLEGLYPAGFRHCLFSSTLDLISVWSKGFCRTQKVTQPINQCAGSEKQVKHAG